MWSVQRIILVEIYPCTMWAGNSITSFFGPEKPSRTVCSCQKMEMALRVELYSTEEHYDLFHIHADILSSAPWTTPKFDRLSSSVRVSLIEQGPAGSGGSNIKCKLSCLAQHLSQHWQDRQMPNLLSKQISLTMQPLNSEITNVTSDLAI